MSLESGEETGKDNQKKPEQNETDNLKKLIEEQSKMMAAMSEKMLLLEKSHGVKGQGLTAEDVVLIVKTLSEANKKDKEIDYEAGILEEEIDKDDYDEKGVRFTCPAGGYVLSDDIRKGQRVVLPYRKKTILFEHASTRRTGSGRYSVAVPISAYTSHSLKEIQWIRDHSLFGIVFYETTNDAANADAIRATKLARIMGHIRNYEHIELIRACKQHDITPDEDAAITRSKLALKIIHIEEELEKTSSATRLAETNKHQMLVSNNSGKRES